MPHIAVESGGRRRLLPEPSLAVYMDAELYPAQWRGGKHAGRGGGMPMLVERDGTPPDVYAELLAEGSRRRFTVEYAERRRRQWEAKRERREER